MFRAFSSLLPSSSTPPPVERAYTPVAQGEEPKQPRRPFQPQAPEHNDHESTISFGVSALNAPLGPVSDGDQVQGVKPSELAGDGDRVLGKPETISYSLESDADSEIIDLGARQTDHTVTRFKPTTTDVGERRTADAQKAGQSTTAREGTIQPRQNASTFSSKTTAAQQRYEAQSSVQSGVRREASFFQETPTATVTGTLSSASRAVEARRVTVPLKSAHSSVRQQFLQIERLYCEERDRIVALMTDEREHYKCLYEEQFEAFQAENERLLQDISASASRITLLEMQLTSRGEGCPGNTQQYDTADSNITTTITTNITTITTTITTVTTRIEQWKGAVPKNQRQIRVSSKELEQLSSDLSNVSSQMTELHQHYVEFSRGFSSVRRELQATLSLYDEKDRTTASLTAEVAGWKSADAAKAQEITTVRRDNEALRRDLSVTSSRIVELQQRHDTQASELGSARDELQTTASLIEEKDCIIASFAAEVARWKRSDATKAEEIAATRRDYEKLQRDLSASASQTAELQKRCDMQSKELVFVRNELQAGRSLVEERERTISALTAEVDQWELADAAKAEQITAECQEKEGLQHGMASLSSEIVELRKRHDMQSKDIISLRSELQSKVSLLEERDHTITSLTTEVAHVKREGLMKTEQIAAARREVEQLRCETSSASSQIVDLQERHEAQLKELNTVRDEFHKIEILYPDGTDQVPVQPSKHAVSQHIARALEKKNKQMEEIRRDFAVATSRNIELQKSYEALSAEVSTVRDELKVKTSENEGTITSLTAQIEQWKRADTTKAERIAATLKQVEKLQLGLSTSTSQLAELQSRYEVQSREFISVRTELQTKISLHEGKDRTIASLTAELDQWRRVDAVKMEQISTTLQEVEKLRQESSAYASRLAELQGRYEAQSRELVSVRKELQTKISLHEGEDRTIASLTAELDQRKRADAMRMEQISITLKQVEKLQRDLSTCTSRFAELQERYEAQSRELVSVREELQTRIASFADKDRTATVLAAQVEEWERIDALRVERNATARKQAEDRDSTNSSQIAVLQQHHNMQSAQLAELTSQIEKWKRSDAAKAEELAVTREKLQQLQHALLSDPQ